MDDWKIICRIDDIPVLGARRVRRPAGVDVAVFRTASFAKRPQRPPPAAGAFHAVETWNAPAAVQRAAVVGWKQLGLVRFSLSRYPVAHVWPLYPPDLRRRSGCG